MYKRQEQGAHEPPRQWNHDTGPISTHLDSQQPTAVAILRAQLLHCEGRSRAGQITRLITAPVPTALQWSAAVPRHSPEVPSEGSRIPQRCHACRRTAQHCSTLTITVVTPGYATNVHPTNTQQYCPNAPIVRGPVVTLVRIKPASALHLGTVLAHTSVFPVISYFYLIETQKILLKNRSFSICAGTVGAPRAWTGRTVRWPAPAQTGAAAAS